MESGCLRRFHRFYDRFKAALVESSPQDMYIHRRFKYRFWFDCISGLAGFSQFGCQFIDGGLRGRREANHKGTKGGLHHCMVSFYRGEPAFFVPGGIVHHFHGKCRSHDATVIGNQ